MASRLLKNPGLALLWILLALVSNAVADHMTKVSSCIGADPGDDCWSIRNKCFPCRTVKCASVQHGRVCSFVNFPDKKKCLSQMTRGVFPDNRPIPVTGGAVGATQQKECSKKLSSGACFERCKEFWATNNDNSKYTFINQEAYNCIVNTDGTPKMVCGCSQVAEMKKINEVKD